MSGTEPDEPTQPFPSGPPPTYQPPPQQPYSQPTYGQQPYGQPAYQQPAYGQPPYQPGYPAPYPVTPPNDNMGIAAMIVGIASLVLMCGYGFGLLGSPVALVLGRISMKRIDRSQGQVGGRGFAMAGFVLGIIGTVLLVIAVVVLVVVIIVAVNGGFDDTGNGYDSTYGLAASH